MAASEPKSVAAAGKRTLDIAPLAEIVPALAAPTGIAAAVDGLLAMDCVLVTTRLCRVNICLIDI